MICSDFAVGFSATSYVSTETVGYVSICVDVSKPAGEIALQPFTVGLLPEPGMQISLKVFASIAS